MQYELTVLSSYMNIVMMNCTEALVPKELFVNRTVRLIGFARATISILVQYQVVLSTQRLHVQLVLRNTTGETQENLFSAFLIWAGQDASRKSKINIIDSIL